jgi:hypothetical protein
MNGKAIAATIIPTNIITGLLVITNIIGVMTIMIASIVCLLPVKSAIPIVSIKIATKTGLNDKFLYVIAAYAKSGVANANNIPV